MVKLQHKTGGGVAKKLQTVSGSYPNNVKMKNPLGRELTALAAVFWILKSGYFNPQLLNCHTSQFAKL